jgi:hypothetical protein
MRLVSGVVLALSLAASVQAAPLPPDYYAPRTGLDADHALLVDVWSGKPETIAALRHHLEATPAPAIAADGWSFLCDFDYHSGLYAQGETDCHKAIAANPSGGDANTLAIIDRVKSLPPPSSSGSARVALTSGVHIPVHAGDYADFAIADTGAEISVMMQSVAQAAHVNMLGASKDVGGTTGSVSGNIGLLPLVQIGDATVRNIPVLVLPDAQLTITHGKDVVKLPFILSLYAMAGFGKVAFLDHDKWLALGAAAPADAAGAVPLMWHPQGIAVPLDGPGGRHAAHFDSGANVSYLFDAGLPLVSDAERAKVSDSTRDIGGVSGVVKETIRKLPVASLTLAGQPLVLKDVDVAKEPDTGEAARLGEDVLQDYSAVIFDFGTMQFSVSP